MKTFKNIFQKAVLTVLAAMIFTASASVNTQKISAYGNDDVLDTNGKLKVNYTEAFPTLDGVPEEMWNEATSYDISEVIEVKDGENAPKGTMKMLWSGANLYFYCEVTDDKVCGSDSVLTDNDCLKLIFAENASDGKNTPKEQLDDPLTGNLTVILYSHYKTEEFGDTINNDRRDYVAAEYKKTDKGYNLEALIKLSKNVMIGDEMLFDAELFSISEANGEVTGKTAVAKELSTLIFTNESKIYMADDDILSIVAIDMSYDYSAAKLTEIKDKYDPFIVGVMDADEADRKLITDSFDGFQQYTEEGSKMMILYNYDHVEVTEKGKAGEKGDCLYGFFRNKTSGDSFYVYVTKLDRKYAAVRRAEASAIRSDINLKNMYGYPEIVLVDTGCADNSFTYEIFDVGELSNVFNVAKDIVVREKDNTLYTFLTDDSIGVKTVRMIPTDGEKPFENQGAIAMRLGMSAKIDISKAKRRTVIYIIEGILTAALGAGLAILIYKKTKGKKKDA